MYDNNYHLIYKETIFAESNQIERHKKRSTAVLQPLFILKYNTMKNTVQRYGY